MTCAVFNKFYILRYLLYHSQGVGEMDGAIVSVGVGVSVVVGVNVEVGVSVAVGVGVAV